MVILLVKHLPSSLSQMEQLQVELQLEPYVPAGQAEI